MVVSRQALDEIRSKVDLAEFLEKRGTHFTVAGQSLKALCPVHSERSPSFNVRPDIQRYHCFGCGISGDIFNLVQELESLSFMGAVQFLADETGVKIISEEEDEQYRKTKRLLEIVDIACAWFRHNYEQLPESHPAKQNLADRNLLAYSMTDKMIGYAPNGGLLPLLAKAGYSVEEALEAGVAVATDNSNQEATARFNSMNKAEVKDKFRNRLMWTLCDISGRPIGFSGRIIYTSENSKAPKYLNSPATPLFKKSHVLLNLHAAKKEIVRKQEVILVEGQTDVNALIAAGIENVVATCGTAFGASHAEILSRLAATGKGAEKFKFVFCFDGDAAGVKAAETVFTKVPEIQLNSYVASMTPRDPETGETLILDPCDVRLKFGDSALIELLEKQVSLIEFILKQELGKWELATPEGRTGFINAAQNHISQVKDPLQRDAYLRKIAFWSGVPYSQLQSTKAPVQRRQQTDDEGRNVITVETLPVEERLTAFLLQYPAETKAAFLTKNLTSDMFAKPERIQKIIDTGFDGFDNHHEDSEEGTSRDQNVVDILSHLDLGVKGSVDATVKHLVENFLQVRYMEEIENLNARLASATSDNATITDENLLIEMLTQQQVLKKKYSR